MALVLPMCCTELTHLSMISKVDRFRLFLKAEESLLFGKLGGVVR
jgi:hypothetical protein